ncbi:conserved hypothetical protein [Gammaproteobacteria bacterium]
MFEITNPMVIVSREDLEKIIYTAATKAAEKVIETFSNHGDLWDAERIAQYLGVSSKTILDDWSSRSGFPKAIVLGSGPKAKRRWNPVEIRNWADRQK